MGSAAEILESARKRAHLTQAELGRRAGVAQSVISVYEAGLREPSWATLTKLVHAAGLDMDVSFSHRPLRKRVEEHREELLGALTRLGASNIRVFGSVARGDDSEGSDIDLLVDLADGVGLLALIAMRGEAERILGAPVDVIPVGGLKADLTENVMRDAVSV